MTEVKLYTDGGCRGNGKRRNIGAIGGILIHPKTGTEKTYKEAFDKTTNNRMELLAVIKGLNLLKKPCLVHVYSDSSYLINAFNKGWLKNWKRHNWVRKPQPLKNVDLWQELDALSEKHELVFHKVKGHADNDYNNLADQLVNEAMDEFLEECE